MSTKFFPLTVKSIEKTTEDCSLISFDINENLKDTFQYKQGQYLTLKAMIDGEEVRRSYSLCSSPIENKWQVAVKEIENGLFSTFANRQLKAGDLIDVMPPNGQFFTPVEPEKAKNYIAFAAGSGITPILSIIKTHLAKEPNSTFKLFYLNKNIKSIILKEEVEGIKNTYFNRFEIFHFLTQEHRSLPLLNGRFTSEKLQEITQHIVDVKTVDECFICGPEEMIFLIRDELMNAGLEKNKIHFELFTTAGSKHKNSSFVKKDIQQAAHTKVTIIDGGRHFHFDMGEDEDNILDAALSKSADLPFACKGGVCCTCKAKLMEGTVDMKVNYALEEEDLKKGYILTCQAVPTSDVVVVDFDH